MVSRSSIHLRIEYDVIKYLYFTIQRTTILQLDLYSLQSTLKVKVDKTIRTYSKWFHRRVSRCLIGLNSQYVTFRHLKYTILGCPSQQEAVIPTYPPEKFNFEIPWEITRWSRNWDWWPIHTVSPSRSLLYPQTLYCFVKQVCHGE